MRLVKTIRGLSSPAILLTGVWCITLACVAIGPVEFPGQPSLPVLILVTVGLSLFAVGQGTGAWCFRTWLQHREDLPAPSNGALNIAVVVTSLLGLTGIALIAVDRVVLSGVSAREYAELLRCTPSLIDVIEIKRTALLYAGYLTFSFGFVSLVLFVLKGEEVRGWAAILAQLSMLCPVGYALLYSGRMPILLAIVLVVAAVMVRIGQGQRPLPSGHHLLIKTIAIVVLFGLYTGAVWSSRRDFCTQMNGLIEQLRARVQKPEPEWVRDLKRAEMEEMLAAERKKPALRDPAAQPGNGRTGNVEQEEHVREAEEKLTDLQRELAHPGAPRTTDAISAADLNAMIDAAKKSPGGGERPYYPPDLNKLLVLGLKREAWHTRPRAYVLSAVESGWVSQSIASGLLNSYFYLTHGSFVLDLVWRARAQFSPHWGIYEIGVLSPMLRVFAPQSQQLSLMNKELDAAKINGSFPSVWAAAYIDFGGAGAVIYVLIWGFIAGWTAFGTRHSCRASLPLLLTFILASILLSPIQGPLGSANSFLTLISMAIAGIALDRGNLGFQGRGAGRESAASGSGQVSTS